MTNSAQIRDDSDSRLHDILIKPTTVFRSVRASARSLAPSVMKMKVGDKVYSDPNVGDGMYDSLNSLKAPDMEEYRNLS